MLRNTMSNRLIANTDTIAAIATAPGKGGVGIVRVSGNLSRFIAEKILKRPPKISESHKAIYSDFLNLNNSQNNSVIDAGISIFFNQPNSFTGEDVLELQGHGGPVVLGMLLDQVLALGARLAKPGEFTERAFLNHKLDLAEAEAVADLINAQSEEAAKSAIKSLQGYFSKEINLLVEELIKLRLYVEAAIDFPEEEIDFLTNSHVLKNAEDLLKNLQKLLHQAKKGELLQTGMTVVIAGRPNAGKSSLLNLLSGKDSAIVTPIPGTTRDVLKESIAIEGVPLHILDTAGIRVTQDLIEQEGVKRAHKAISQADRVLLVIDALDLLENKFDLEKIRQEIFPDNLDFVSTLEGETALKAKPKGREGENIPMTYVINKIDVLNHDQKLTLFSHDIVSPLVGETGPKMKSRDREGVPILKISAKTGEGLDNFKKHLLACVGLDQLDQGQENLFSARKRHLVCIEQAIDYLNQAISQLKHHQAGELFAEDCRLAQESLNQITGEFTSDDLLGRIFSSFCIGK